MPEEPVDIAKTISDDGQVEIPRKRARLMALLEEEAKDKPCTLNRLEVLCNAQGLSWAWVEKTIQSLSNAGALIFPRPWEVQLVKTAEDTPPTSPIIVDISGEIISFLKSSKGKVRVDEVVRYFKGRGVSEESVDSSLERLMRSGDIFQPAVGYVNLV
jgi:hypothetical protein